MYEVKEQDWFTSQRTHSQLSGQEHTEVSSHLDGTMLEIIEQSVESRDVHITRYDGNEMKEIDTKVVAQSTKQANQFQLLSIRNDIRIGDELSFDGLHYLVITPATQTPLYDRSYGLRQTHSLIIYKETKIDTGQRDPIGKPVYRVEKTETVIRLAFEPTTKEGLDTSTWAPINLPKSKIYFYVQINPETSKWKELQTLKVLGKDFKIISIDHTNTLEDGSYGVLLIEAERAV